MTVPVPDQLEYISDADGVTKDFSYPKRFLQKDEIVVLLRDANGVDTPQILNTHYTIAGSSWPSGGTVTFNTAPASGLKVVLYRMTQAKQTVDLENNQRNDAPSVELQLDRLAMGLQDRGRIADIALAGLKVEIQERKAADTILQQNINAETAARIAADQQERSERIAGDNALGGRIDNERLERIAADNAERSERIAADNIERAERIAGDKAVASLIGQSGSIEVPVYDSRLAVTFANVKSTIDAIRTSGYSFAGDGGEALYKRVPSEPSHAGKVQSDDGAWWEIAENVVNPLMFGAVFDGVTSDHAAWQDAINWAGSRRGSICFPQGVTLIDDELDFTGTYGVAIIGQGHRQSTIYVTPFGAAKKLFKFPNPSTLSRPSAFNILKDFEIQGRNTANTTTFASADHPIGIYIPYGASDQVHNIVTRSLGNTPYWSCSANNLRFVNCWAYGCGFHYTQDDAFSINARLTGVLGQTTISATGDYFEDAHVGKNIHIISAGSLGGSQPAAYKIVSVSSGKTYCTVDRPISRSFTDQVCTFEGMTCNVNSGQFLTSNQPIFRPQDVGRYIYVENAGANGSCLITTIDAYVSATQIRLTDAALNTATNQFFYFTPIHFHGQLTKDTLDTVGLNDIKIQDCLVEGCSGVDYFYGNGVNIWHYNNKQHGIGTNANNRFGRNVRSLIIDSSRAITCSGMEIDYGYTKDSGNILICGGFASAFLDDFTCAVTPETQALIDFRPTNANSTLEIGAAHLNKNPQYDTEFVVFGNGRSWANVSVTGKIKTRQADLYAYGGPLVSKSFASGRTALQDDTITTIKPQFPLGLIAIWTSTGAANGLVYCRTSSSPSCVAVAAGSSVSTGTSPLTNGTADGVDGNLNISCAEGVITIKNRIGSTQSVSWAFLG